MAKMTLPKINPNRGENGLRLLVLTFLIAASLPGVLAAKSDWVKLQYNTPYCMNDCQTVYNFTKYADLSDSLATIAYRFVDNHGLNYSNVKNLKLEVLQAGNWNPISLAQAKNAIINAPVGTTWTIRISGNIPAGVAVDNIVSFAGYDYTEYAWWSSNYTFRTRINCTNITGLPVIINGTAGFTINTEKQYVWTKCVNNLTLYFVNSTIYEVVANDSTPYPYEVELGNKTGFNSTAVWTDYIGVWHFTNGLNDSGVNNLAGVWNTTAPSQEQDILKCPIAKCYVFGANKYGSIPTKPLTQFGNGNFSVETWIYPLAWSGGMATISNSFFTGAYWQGIHWEQGDDSGVNFAYGRTDGTLNTGNNAVAVNTLNHLYTGRFNENASIYLNGTYRTSEVKSNINASGTADFHIGRNPDGTYPRYFNGYLDEFRIATKYRNESEIKAVYYNAVGVAGFGTLDSLTENQTDTTPAMQAVVIAPVSPENISAINCTARAQDVENTTLRLDFVWFKNFVLQPLNVSAAVANNSNYTTILGGSYTKGDNITCAARAWDGVGFSAWLNDSVMVICTSNWTCGGYAACNTSDLRVCNAALDIRGCGESYAGNFSEFTPQACDYCNSTWECSGYNGVCGNLSTLTCLGVNETSNCYNVTGLAADNFTGNYSDYDLVCADAVSVPSLDLGTTNGVLLLLVLAFMWVACVAIGLIFRNFAFGSLGFFLGIVLGFLLLPVHWILTAAMFFLNAVGFFGSVKLR